MSTPLDRFRAERDASPVYGRSPDGYVEVSRDATGRIGVSIREGAFRELTHRQLTDEVRGALTAAVSDYSRTADRLFHRWGGDW